ncbi:MFS transporter [Natronosalvus rutilus]|uniref:MFS transporter n=1 Tax=Natronosalvus rutilus TaxID=2953753 RepID=A0A9E7N9I0_9EURY|nr:MFS transporter [Natronosalvus rutilus]UTF52582.1 MFS transporter [Natronosalvus rutilus]
MSRTEISAPIARYYLFQATDSVGFIWPVFTLFLLWKDLTFAQIGTLGAVSALLVVVLEVPTGYVADRLGRRNALAIGMAAMTLSIAGFVVADSFLSFLVLYAVWSVSLAFQSGTADAWLYETLRAKDDEGTEADFTRIRGRGGSVHQWVSAVTMIGGGFLYAIEPTYPFLASAALNGAGVAVVLTMPKNAQFDGTSETNVADSPGVLETLSMLRRLFAGPSFRVFVPLVALFFALVNVADTYIQPITVDVLNDASPVSTLAGSLPEEAALGFLYAGFAVLAAITSYHAETVRSLVGLRTALLTVPVVTAATVLAPAVVPVLAIPVFFGMKGARALYEPLVNQYLNDRSASVGRATVLSAASMGYALVRVPLKPLAGFVADLTSPITLLALLGGGFLAFALPLVALRSPIPETACSSEERPPLQDAPVDGQQSGRD